MLEELINFRQTDFRTRKIFSDKEGYCIMIKGSILQEDKPIIKLFNSKLNRETDKWTIIVRDFNIFLLVIGRSSRQNINKETVDFSSTIDLLI